MYDVRQHRFRIDSAKPPKACEQSQLMKRLWSSSDEYPSENRSELKAQLTRLQEVQVENLASSDSLVDQATETLPRDGGLRQRVSGLDSRISDLQVELTREQAAISDLEQLADELRAQSARLTPAIVAETTLVDLSPSAPGVAHRFVIEGTKNIVGFAFRYLTSRSIGRLSSTSRVTSPIRLLRLHTLTAAMRQSAKESESLKG